MTMTFLANGYSVKYVPIEYAARAGESKFHWWADTTRYLTQVVRMVLSYNPLRIFMPLGGALLLVGLAKLGYDIVDKDFRVATNTLVILFAALQVVSIGLLADLVVRMGAPANEVEPASVEHRSRPTRRALGLHEPASITAAATSRQLGASARARAAKPGRSARTRSIAPAKASGSPGGARAPVTPSITRSGRPPTSVAATGRPAA